jgi:hypothetical protein
MIALSYHSLISIRHSEHFKRLILSTLVVMIVVYCQKKKGGVGFELYLFNPFQIT